MNWQACWFTDGFPAVMDPQHGGSMFRLRGPDTQPPDTTFRITP